MKHALFILSAVIFMLPLYSQNPKYNKEKQEIELQQKAVAENIIRLLENKQADSAAVNIAMGKNVQAKLNAVADDLQKFKGKSPLSEVTLYRNGENIFRYRYYDEKTYTNLYYINIVFKNNDKSAKATKLEAMNKKELYQKRKKPEKMKEPSTPSPADK